MTPQEPPCPVTYTDKHADALVYPSDHFKRRLTQFELDSGSTGHGALMVTKEESEAKTSGKAERLPNPKIIWALLAAMLGIGLVVGARGIAGPWRFGHLGYTGAAFSQGARNTLRFGTLGQAVYHFDRTVAPQPEELYTHHPLLIHVHLVALQSLLGDAPWVSRLVPVVHTFGLAWLVFLLAYWFWDVAPSRGPPSRRRLCEWPLPWLALCAFGLFYVTVPVLAFSPLVNHEQPGLFWSLAHVGAFLRFRRQPTRAWFVAVLGTFLVAANWDFPANYIAFFLFCYGLIRFWLFERASDFPWRRFLVIYPLVVLANMGLFIAIAHWLRGTGDLESAFLLRTRWPSGYPERLWTYVVDLFGPVQLTLVAGWLVYFVARMRRGLGEGGAFWRERDVLPLSFLFAQVMHSLAFANAGHIHCFWLYQLVPVVVFTAVDLLGALRRLQLRGYPRRRDRRWVVGSALLGAAVVQLVFAWQQWGWFVAAGGEPQNQGPRNGVAETQWAESVYEFARRDSASRGTGTTINRYWGHPSLSFLVVQLPYHLDALVEWRGSARSWLRDHADGAVLADLHYAGDTERKRLLRLAARHASAVWEDRFIMIWNAPSAPKGEKPRLARRFIFSPESAGPLWRWLRHPLSQKGFYHDPGTMDARALMPARAALAPLSPSLSRHADQNPRGRHMGPGRLSWRCPQGMRVSGVQIGESRSRRFADPLALVCSLPSTPNLEVPGEMPSHSEIVGPMLGHHWALSTRTLLCPEGDYLTGLVQGGAAQGGAAQGGEVPQIALRCESPGAAPTVVASGEATDHPEMPPEACPGARPIVGAAGLAGVRLGYRVQAIAPLARLFCERE